MSWDSGFRRFHRWLSVAFTAAFVFTSVALAIKVPAPWVSYVPLAPLALLFVTGVYLFAQPYLARRRRARAAAPVGSTR